MLTSPTGLPHPTTVDAGANLQEAGAIVNRRGAGQFRWSHGCDNRFRVRHPAGLEQPYKEHFMTQAVDSRNAAPDFAAIKQRQQATWASGDFAVIGTTLQIVGEELAEAVDVRSGEQ